MSVQSVAQRVAFGRLSDRDRVEAVARQIRQAIVAGLLPVGARLPSEAALAASLGVSNVTLREALEVLRREGLVETRRGRSGGTFVRPEATSLVEASSHDDLAAQTLDDLRDLADYHAAISGAAAALAARRLTGSSIESLRELAGAVAAAGDRRARARADARFHVEVAALSRSALLTRAELALQGELTPLLWLARTAAAAARAAADHLEIVAALAARDADRARALAEAHVQQAASEVLRLRMGLPRWMDGSDGSS